MMLNNMAETTSTVRPYKCTALIALPTHECARQLRDVISVDREISDKVAKSFSIVGAGAGAGAVHDDGLDDAAMRILQM